MTYDRAQPQLLGAFGCNDLHFYDLYYGRYGLVTSRLALSL